MSKGQTKKTRETAGNRRKLTRAEKKQRAAVIRQAKGDGKAHTAQQTIPYLAMYPDGICKMAQRRYSKSIAFEDINYQLAQADEKTAAVIRQAKGDGKAHTAQQTIPYLAMYPDGICKMAQRRYSKSIAFEDINYQLAQADEKTAIFENWCDCLNYFDARVNVQLSFITQGSQQEQAARALHIPPQHDDFNSIRTEYSDMLKSLPCHVPGRYLQSGTAEIFKEHCF